MWKNFRLLKSLWKILLSFLSGTMMVRVPDKHLVKIVKWFFSKIFPQGTRNFHVLTLLLLQNLIFHIFSPQAIFRDPFRGGNNILVCFIIEFDSISNIFFFCNHTLMYWDFVCVKVICDTYTPAGEPIPTNKRAKAAEIFNNKKVNEEIPWFVHYLKKCHCNRFTLEFGASIWIFE